MSAWLPFRDAWHGTEGASCAKCGRERHPYVTCASVLCRSAAGDAFAKSQQHAALTRALTAQAWAHAIALCGDDVGETNDPECPSAHAEMRDRVHALAGLPAPADLAAELLDG